MHFDTPEAMAEHLRYAVTDEEAVTAMVKVMFPAYVAPRRAEPPKPVRAYPVSAPVDPWNLYHERSMEQGSKELLGALWRSHPRILNTLAKQGLQVVHP